MKTGFLLMVGMVMAGCASEPAKPGGQWNVNVKTESQERVWVAKADGSRQCAAQGVLLSPDLAANQLKAAGVVVFSFKKGNDGKMHVQKCGAATGATVDVEISRRDIPRALTLGYREKPTQLQ